MQVSVGFSPCLYAVTCPASVGGECSFDSSLIRIFFLAWWEQREICRKEARYILYKGTSSVWICVNKKYKWQILRVTAHKEGQLKVISKHNVNMISKCPNY